MRTYNVDDVLNNFIRMDRIQNANPVFLHNAKGRGMIYGSFMEQIKIADYNLGRQVKVVDADLSFNPQALFEKSNINLSESQIFLSSHDNGAVTKGFARTQRGIERTFSSRDGVLELSKKRGIVWFDTETTGAIHSPNWSMTEGYFYKIMPDGTTSQMSVFLKQSDSKTSEVQSLIEKARASLKKSGFDGLSQDERRDLIQYMSYKKDRHGALVSEKAGLSLFTNLDDSMLDAAEAGLKNLNQHGVAGGESLSQQLNKFVNGATLAGHNIIDFDLPLLQQTTGGSFAVGDVVDTLPFFRSIMPGETVLGSNLDDAGKYIQSIYEGQGKTIQLAVGDQFRHTAAGDVRMNSKIFEAAVHDQGVAQMYYNQAAALKNAGSSKVGSYGSRISGISTRSVFRTSPKDIVYRSFNGKVEPIHGDTLINSMLFKNGVQYDLEGIKKTEGGVIAKLIEPDTGNNVYITKQNIGELEDFFEDVFGGQMSAQSMRSAEMQTLMQADKNFSTLFKGDNAYYNLKTQMGILDDLRSQRVDLKNIQAVRDAVGNMSNITTAQKNRFLQNYKTLSHHESGLKNILTQLDEIFPGGGGPKEAAYAATHKKNIALNSLYGELAFDKKVMSNGNAVKGLNLGESLVLKKGQNNTTTIGRFIRNQLPHSDNPTISDYRRAYKSFLDRMVGEKLISAQEADEAMSQISSRLQNNLSAQAGGNAKGTGSINSYLNQLLNRVESSKWSSLSIKTMKGVDFNGKSDMITSHIREVGSRLNQVETLDDLFKGASESFSQNITAVGKQQLLRSRGIGSVASNGKHFAIKSGIDEHLKQMAESFQKKHIGMFLTESTTEGQVEVLLYNVNDYNKVFKHSGSSLSILPNAPAAKVAIPVGKDGTLQYKNMAKIDSVRIGASRSSSGSWQFDLDLASHHAVGRLNSKYTIDKASQMIQDGNIVGASKFLDRSVYREVSSLGQSETLSIGRFVDDALSHTKSGGSLGQQWVRKGVIDFEPAVSEILQNGNWETKVDGRSFSKAMQYVQLASQGGFDETILNKYFLTTSNGLFTNEARASLYQLGDMLKQMNINLVGVKAEAVQIGKLATRDPRSLAVLGNITSGSKENMLSVLNHLNINTTIAKANMEKAGISAERIKDLFARDLITQQYASVYNAGVENKIVSGINANMLYMDDFALQQHWQNWAKLKNIDTANIIAPSVYADAMVLSQDVVPALEVHRKRGIWLDPNFKFTDRAQEILKQGQPHTVTDANGMLIGFSGKKEVRLKQGDILEAIDFDSNKNQVRLLYNELDARQMGKKILSEGGQRGVIATIDDDFIQYVAQQEGFTGTFSGIIGNSGLKATNVADIYGSKLKYILSQADDETIRRALTNGEFSHLGSILKYSDEYGRYLIDGDLSITSKGEGFLAGVLKEVDTLGEKLGVKTATAHGVYVGRSNLRVADVYHYETPVGFGSDEFLARNSKVRFGAKELLAIDEVVKGASLADGQEYTALVQGLKRGMMPSDSLGADGRTIVKSLRLTSELNQVGTNLNDFKATHGFLEVGIGGKTHEFDATHVALDEIFGEASLTNGRYLEDDYMSTTYHRLKQMSPGSKFAIVTLPEEVELTTKGNLANRKVSSLVVPLIEPERINGDFMPTQVERHANQIFDAMHQVEIASEAERKTALDQLSMATKKYIASTGEIFNKDSEIFKTLTSKRLSNAINVTALGQNIAMYNGETLSGAGSLAHRSMEQSAAVNIDDVKGMLAIDDSLWKSTNDLSDDGKKAFDYLRWAYKEQMGQGYQAQSGMGIQQQVDEMVAQMVDMANIDKHGSKARPMVGQILRYPSTNTHSTQFANIYTSNQIGAGSARFSAGLEALVRGDHDGDKINIAMALMNSDIVDEDDYLRQAKEARKVIDYQKKISQEIGQKIYETEMAAAGSDLAQRNKGAINDIARMLANQEAQALEQSASRFGKSALGSVSNTSTAVRNTLEVVQMLGPASQGGARAQGLVLTGFMETLEQNMISSKKAGEAIQGSLIEAKFGLENTWTDDVWAIVTQKKGELADKIKDIRNFQDDSVFALMDDLGLATKQDGHYIINSSQVLEKLKQIGVEGLDSNLAGAEGVSSEYIKQSLANMDLRLGDVGSNYNQFIQSDAAIFGRAKYGKELAGEVLETVDRLWDPSDASHLNRNVSNILLGEEGILKESEALRQRYAKRIEEGVAQRAAAGMDDLGNSAMMKKMAQSSGSAASFGKAVAPIAIGVAALWAASAMIAPPRIDQTPQTGEQEFDPSLADRISAGAPAGSAPTARLVPKSLTPSYNININANSFKDLTNEQIAGIIEGEVYRQTSMNVNLNLDSRDSRESLDRRWFEQKISSFI